jgi:hypothetical protein
MSWPPAGYTVYQNSELRKNLLGRKDTQREEELAEEHAFTSIFLTAGTGGC